MKLLIAFLLLPLGCAAQESAPVQMAPVSVKAGPLAFIGIRCSASVGMFGMVSSHAHFRELVIIEVFKDSGGQRAGLLPQDHILRIAGVPITDYSVDTLKEIGDKEKGDVIELEVQSAGAKQPRTVLVTLGARKAPSG